MYDLTKLKLANTPYKKYLKVIAYITWSLGGTVLTYDEVEDMINDSNNRFMSLGRS